MKQKRRNSKLNVLLNSLIAVFFLLCILLLLYPYVSNLFIGAAQRETFFSYDSRTSQMTDEEKEALIAAALRYNKRLSEAPVGYDFDDAVTEEYMSLLDLGDNGLMGTLEIPCIKLKLPVYHTVNEEILQIGVGHVQGSSFPVEGCDSNVMLMAHRGLPNSELFNNIDRLEAGDSFQIKVLDTVLDYRVIEIKTVKPNDVAKIGITKGKQLCTLVTCTPYGINSDRLVVTGELSGSYHIDMSGGESVNYSYSMPFERKGGPTIDEILALIGLLMIISAITCLLYSLVKWRKRLE